MLLKRAAVCLLALAVLGFCNAQDNYPGGKKIPGINWPKDPQQQKQTFDKPLTWTYPEEPKPKPKPDVPFQQRYPVSAATVAVDCRDNIAHVEVNKDFFGVGQLINSADLTLGPCSVVAEDPMAQVLIFESQLQDCGSTLRMTGDSFIYTFTLNYNPKPLGGPPVVRTNSAAVIVECHYPRKQNVSSLALEPLWVPFSAAKMAEEFLYFTLTLKTDDWQYDRPSYQYFLGDLINIEASVKQYYHVPLRVFVDNCVATLSTGISSGPRYAFIEQGCMVDSRITGSDSKFMARSAENILNFQIEAFRFQGINSGEMYITCNLRATSVNQPIDSDDRACSYINGWRESSGYDGACSSCESLASGLVTAGNVIVTGHTGASTGGGTVNTGLGTGTTGMGTGTTGTRPGSTGMGTGTTGTRPGSTGMGTGTTGTRPGSTGMGTGITGTRPGSTGMGTGITGTRPGSTGMGTGITGTGTGSTGTRPGSTGMGTGSTGIVTGTTGTGTGTGSTGTGTGSTGTRPGSTGGGTWGVLSSPKLPQARRVRDMSQHEVLEWEGDVTLGPISIEEKLIA